MTDYTHVILDLTKTAEERIQAAFKLENIADTPSIEALGKALLTDPSPIVRHECAFALGETAAPTRASKYLTESIENDSHPVVKHEALLALATLGDRSAIPFIERWLNHPDLLVSESAEIAIQRLESSQE